MALSKIVRGCDFSMEVHVITPQWTVSGQIWEEFNINECTNVGVNLICTKDQVVIPLSWHIKDNTTNVITCDVQGKYLHSGAVYALEIVGLDAEGKAWRYKNKSVFAIVDATKDAVMQEALMADPLEVNAEIGLVVNVIPVLGPQGPQGDTGPQGEKGDTGATGQQGDKGDVGPQGDTGAQGDKGDIGPQGEQGPQGNTGEQGPQGEKGQDGSVSFEDLTPEQIEEIRGPQGDKGETGPQGEKGDIGAQGPQGEQGLMGEQGPQGDTGAQGNTGEQGPQGDTGAQGPMGEQGPAGERGLDGAQGPMGEQGPAGERGLDGAQGPQGDAGAQGPQGAQGPAGDGADIDIEPAKIVIDEQMPSNPDPNAVYMIQKPLTFKTINNQEIVGEGNIEEVGPQGETGPQGEQGTQGNKGDVGPQGETGPQGEQGTQGNKGDVGPQGDQGNTGAQGPQGDKGDTGPQGDKGETGPQGDKGDTGVQGPQGNMGQQGPQGDRITPVPNFDWAIRAYNNNSIYIYPQIYDLCENKYYSLIRYIYKKGITATVNIAESINGDHSSPLLVDILFNNKLAFHIIMQCVDRISMPVAQMMQTGLSIDNYEVSQPTTIYVHYYYFSEYWNVVVDTSNPMPMAFSPYGTHQISVLDIKVPDLEWSSNSATAILGRQNTYPTLTNTDNVDVTYSSSDTSVATIASYGTVTILTAGTTTISAIFAGDDTYYAKTVSYLLTVSEPVYDYSTDYFTVISLSDNNTVTFDQRSSDNLSKMNYSTDNGTTWSQMTSNGVTLNNGDKVLFKANNTTIGSTSSDGIGRFLLSNNVRIEGNVMSLIAGDNFVNATTMQNSQFANLFSSNSNNYVVDAEDFILPATTLTPNCYDHMFNQNTLLTKPPKLPAMTLAQSCYDCMFEQTGLITTPELPATTLANQCYGGMFQQCPNLTTAVLPATTPVQNCYQYMFYNSHNLNNVTCLLSSGGWTYCASWLYGASSTGTFTTATGSIWSSGTSGIPSGWTVVDAS